MCTLEEMVSNDRLCFGVVMEMGLGMSKELFLLKSAVAVK